MGYRRVIDAVADCGVVGDGATDDWSAMTAGLQQAASTGVPLYLPAINAKNQQTVIGVSKELSVVGSVSIFGDAGCMSLWPRIRALASMRSVLAIAGQCHLAGFGVDAALSATAAVLELGASPTVYDRVSFLNGLSYGSLKSGLTSPTSITVTAAQGNIGPAPAVAQRHNFYSAYPNIPNAGTYTLRCAQGGALGVATFAISEDGGATYPVTPQTMQAVNGLPRVSTVGTAGYGYDSGLSIAWPAATYAVGDRWTVTCQMIVPQGTLWYAINDATVYHDCQWSGSGHIFYSANYPFDFGSWIYQIVSKTPGTVSTTVDSAIVVGSGTQFTTMDLRLGDHIVVNNAGSPLVLPIWCVLDDEHVALQYYANALCKDLSGVDFFCTRGANHGEDPGYDNSIAKIYGGHSTATPVCFQMMGEYGSSIRDVQLDVFAGAGISISNGGVAVNGGLIDGCYWEGYGPVIFTGASISPYLPIQWRSPKGAWYLPGGGPNVQGLVALSPT